jgi:hypothetical protein
VPKKIKEKPEAHTTAGGWAKRRIEWRSRAGIFAHPSTDLHKSSVRI